MKHCLPLWLLLVLLMRWLSAARATAGPTATGRSLAEALNPDGTLQAGAAGSFDARAFRMGTAPDGQPVFRPAGAKGTGDERWADGFNLPNGTDGTVYAVVAAGTDTYIGGSFRVAGNVVASSVAKWNGTAWSSLGTGVDNGVDGTVDALVVANGGEVYVGGNFRQAGRVPAYNVAKWNGTAWSSLGAGAYYGSVFALALANNGDLYAGGYFTHAGTVAANSIAKWDGTVWSALGTGAGNGVSSNGYGGTVNTLAVAANGDVYVGGEFKQAGSAAANGVAKWNGTTWSSLGNGVSGSAGIIRAMVVAGNGDIVVGGAFTQAGGTTANSIARWNGTAWSSLGAGNSNGVNGQVRALAVAGNGEVYAGGNFTQAGGTTASGIARWNGTAWSSLGAGNSNGVDGFVNAVAVAGNGDVYVGGDFIQAGGALANGMAKWRGAVWSSLGPGAGNGCIGRVLAVALAGNGDAYVGGTFTQAGSTAAYGVAKWNGTGWSSLGTGAGNGVNGSVNALAVASNGDVYVGGNFTQAGGTAANYIAKWNGTAWSSLGTGAGNGLTSSVNTLALASGGAVYVGGYFTQAGGVAANGVAKWSGTAWSSLGTGIGGNTGGSSNVAALAVASNGDVYVGGNFTQAGGTAANYIAKWNGTAWSSLGTGTDNGVSGNFSSVNALALTSSGEVYVGGYFSQAGGVAAANVAKWNGTAWSSLGAGVVNFGRVDALAMASNGEVYVGGNFTQAGGSAANNVAKWDGTAWSSLGTGLNLTVSALAAGPAGKLYAGGNFVATGDGSKVMVGFAIYDPAAPLATAAAKAAPAAQLFPNPAHGTATLRLPATAVRQPIALTDALGRLVRQYPAPAGSEAVLDLRGLPAGTYLLRCGELSQRLVVE
ncbi:hypothetical protein MON38_03170 [Hymenobacter sp. DH14]|uniref:Secretion system C-terminal sorting domain-containing protein n=1 Tax=Hymenobacter cyanobacteriorum TaxID=2926463 RepID=A0A9X1VD77_9BACT|nr:hypothetical protein [Hymenobacter cyanobacteriorum]MCI1186405.1 hypothetical protein [Hymenobacter cyanobacteriorum]